MVVKVIQVRTAEIEVIDVETEEQALEIVQERYNNEEEMLTSEDHSYTEFIITKDANGKSNEALADELVEKGKIIFITDSHKALVQANKGGMFDVSMFPKDTTNESILDCSVEATNGGIIQDGDALDAINYAKEF